MFLKIVKCVPLFLLIFLLIYTSVNAQTKVGTTGANFLEMPISVKAIGMGNAGASFVSNNSFYLNPSHLGLLISDNMVSTSMYPTSVKLPAGVSYDNYSIALPLFHMETTNQNFYYGGAFYFTGLSSGTMIERTYQRGTIGGTGSTFKWKDKASNLVLSYAITGNYDIAFGATIKYISQSSLEYKANGFAFDVGGLIRKTYTTELNENVTSSVIPSFGFSVRNYGSDMTFISNSYPLPTSNLFGFSLTINKQKYFSGDLTAKHFSVTPAIDIEKRRDDSWLYKNGIDFSLYEIINFRAGMISVNGFSESKSTFGFTLSTFNFGKFKLLSSDSEYIDRKGLDKFFFEKLNVEYNFAQYDDNYFEKQDYHEIVLCYKL